MAIYDSESKVFRPESPSQATENTEYLPVAQINMRYELYHKRNNWEIVDGKQLPVLTPLIFQPGLNNYSGPGDEETVRAQERAKGCACIVPSDPRVQAFFDGKYANLGGRAKNYMGFVPAMNPIFGSRGKFWLTVFEAPEVVNGEVIWHLDTESYNAFRQHLIDSGIVVNNATTARLLLQKRTQQLQTYETMPVVHAARAEHVERLKSDIAALKAAEPTLTKPTRAAVSKKFRVDNNTEEGL